MRGYVNEAIEEGSRVKGVHQREDVQPRDEDIKKRIEKILGALLGVEGFDSVSHPQNQRRRITNHG